MEPTTQNKSTSLAVNGAPLPKSEINRLTSNLLESAVTLVDNLSILQESLRPVLRNEPLRETTFEEYDTATDLGEFLANVLKKLNVANVQIGDIRSRLEL